MCMCAVRLLLFPVEILAVHYLAEIVSRRGCVCVIHFQQWLNLYYVLEQTRGTPLYICSAQITDNFISWLWYELLYNG